MMHTGDAYRGHYFCYVKDTEGEYTHRTSTRWLLCNDASIFELSPQQYFEVFGVNHTSISTTVDINTSNIEVEKHVFSDISMTSIIEDPSSNPQSEVHSSKRDNKGKKTESSMIIPIAKGAYMVIYRKRNEVLNSDNNKNTSIDYKQLIPQDIQDRIILENEAYLKRKKEWEEAKEYLKLKFQILNISKLLSIHQSCSISQLIDMAYEEYLNLKIASLAMNTETEWNNNIILPSRQDARLNIIDPMLGQNKNHNKYKMLDHMNNTQNMLVGNINEDMKKMTFCLEFINENNRMDMYVCHDTNNQEEDMVMVSVKRCNYLRIGEGNDESADTSDENTTLTLSDKSSLDGTNDELNPPWVFEPAILLKINTLWSTEYVLKIIAQTLHIDLSAASFVKVHPDSGQPFLLECSQDMFLSQWTLGEEVFVDAFASQENDDRSSTTYNNSKNDDNNNNDKLRLYHYLESICHTVQLCVCIPHSMCSGYQSSNNTMVSAGGKICVSDQKNDFLLMGSLNTINSNKDQDVNHPVSFTIKFDSRRQISELKHLLSLKLRYSKDTFRIHHGSESGPEIKDLSLSLKAAGIEDNQKIYVVKGMPLLPHQFRIILVRLRDDDDDDNNNIPEYKPTETRSTTAGVVDNLTPIALASKVDTMHHTVERMSKESVQDNGNETDNKQCNSKDMISHQTLTSETRVTHSVEAIVSVTDTAADVKQRIYSNTDNIGSTLHLEQGTAVRLRRCITLSSGRLKMTSVYQDKSLLRSEKGIHFDGMIVIVQNASDGETEFGEHNLLLEVRLWLPRQSQLCKKQDLIVLKSNTFKDLKKILLTLLNEYLNSKHIEHQPQPTSIDNILVVKPFHWQLKDNSNIPSLKWSIQPSNNSVLESSPWHLKDGAILLFKDGREKELIEDDATCEGSVGPLQRMKEDVGFRLYSPLEQLHRKEEKLSNLMTDT